MLGDHGIYFGQDPQLPQIPSSKGHKDLNRGVVLLAHHFRALAISNRLAHLALTLEVLFG